MSLLKQFTGKLLVKGCKPIPQGTILVLLIKKKGDADTVI